MYVIGPGGGGGGGLNAAVGSGGGGGGVVFVGLLTLPVGVSSFLYTISTGGTSNTTPTGDTFISINSVVYTGGKRFPGGISGTGNNNFINGGAGGAASGTGAVLIKGKHGDYADRIGATSLLAGAGGSGIFGNGGDGNLSTAATAGVNGSGYGSGGGGGSSTSAGGTGGGGAIIIYEYQ